MCAAALRSACSYQSSLAAVTHPGTPYLLKVAQAVEGDMKCIPALVHKQRSIIITLVMLPLLHTGELWLPVCMCASVCMCCERLRWKRGWRHNKRRNLCCGSFIINLSLPHGLLNLWNASFLVLPAQRAGSLCALTFLNQGTMICLVFSRLNMQGEKKHTCSMAVCNVAPLHKPCCCTQLHMLLVCNDSGTVRVFSTSIILLPEIQKVMYVYQK